MSERELRKRIAEMFAVEYLPKMRQEFQRFSDEAREKEQMAMSMSMIVGCPVGIQVGVLRVADPTNDLIDKLVTLFGEYEKSKTAKK